jgi:hypothetical protein
VIEILFEVVFLLCIHLRGFVVIGAIEMTPLIVVRRIWVTPVDAVRVVEDQAESDVPTGVGELTHQIASSGSFHRVVVRSVRVEQAEALLMLRCEGDVNHPAVHGEPGDSFGIGLLARENSRLKSSLSERGLWTC